MKIINFLKWYIKDNTYQDNYVILSMIFFVVGLAGVPIFGPDSFVVGGAGFLASLAACGLHALLRAIKESWQQYNTQIEEEQQRVVKRLAGNNKQTYT